MLLTLVMHRFRIMVIAIPSQEQAIHATSMALSKNGNFKIQNASIVKNIAYAHILENVLWYAGYAPCLFCARAQ